MKIIIEHGNTKREIDGDFNICGAKTDLIELANQILKECAHEFCSGWIKIVTSKQKSIVNTPPKTWDE